MCQLMHLRIKSISIGFDELYGGETKHENPFRDMSPKHADTSRARSQVEKIVMLCLAGPHAQKKYAPDDSHRDYGGTIDLETAATLAMQFFRSKKTADAYINFAREWVCQKFDEPRTWAAVERLADTLMRQQKISGRQAEAIIRGSTASPKPRSRRAAANQASIGVTEQPLSVGENE